MESRKQIFNLKFLIFNQFKKINFKKLFVSLWLLFLPTQLGLHFWPEWSQVMGLRVDYLAPTLYFGDILWIFLLIFNFKFLIFNQFKIFNFKFLIIFLFVIINIFVAGNKWEAGYKWMRIIQWIVTFKLILDNKKLFKEMLLKVLPVWIIGEGLLGLAQVVNGGSLNGIFYWLGERRFSYISLGVAQISYLGQGLIRAYGTFSHPNSFAGFILISLIVYMRYQNYELKITNYELKKRIFYWSVVFCGLLGLFLSGSRTVWGILIILLITNYELRITNWKKTLGTILIFGGLVVLIFSLISNNYRIVDFVGGWDSEGMVKRGGLMVASLKMIKDHLLFGVGAGNFLVRLPEYQQNSGVFWLQPVHNIIILMTVEYGLVGFLMMMKFSIFNFQFSIKKKNNLIVLGIILITGMVDHYWLTLPQNWWLMCVVLSLI
ncbi:hypothetical protein CO009_00885 [Candidatus Shapirobacteria bacterium CG_4_8_14_3_um_filter_35_11]|uniref:O-antigen ligase-related domain-containing protein n=4 Tax=Candidatus Shapironibacteriota TaxID=1752721 RepID=A0A1J5I6M1_9BACT|nr:MAG: hypothetical protein AUK05_02660 [Candidatus Shapirobacteria bacterium CG2_30_35_20]PJC80895.1 MAG: hypothetical protein CO009_00885 [Candidatus Shapirobacteria bacterium CG_4_8_14_3_um_filter_35_11]PJE67196.1 MAG: hypothetical protein COU93_00075 [Candidatus Shapirobacteria bacterium CG10_big_fil_rev_8_21_14_0_10_36_6]